MEARCYLHTRVVLSHAKLLDTLVDVMIPTTCLSRQLGLTLITKLEHTTLLVIHYSVSVIDVISTLSNLDSGIRSSVYKWKALLVSCSHGSLPFSIVALREKHLVALDV